MDNIFGKALRRARRKAFLTQRGLAKQCGINFSYLSKLENGHCPPPGEEVLGRIAEVLSAPKLVYAAGKIPQSLGAMAKENATLAELLTVLSQEILPDEIYQYMIVLAVQHHKKENIFDERLR